MGMKQRASAVALCCFLAAGASSAQKAPHYPLERFSLSNGLRVIVSEDHSAPVIGVALAFDVGSRNETKGRTGFAHLFEHMMFQGTPTVGKGQYMHLIGANGGTMNGFTRTEGTVYISSMPSEKLPLSLWLEADRMRSLSVNAENLKNQQEVVKEEKRLNYDNQPYVEGRRRRLQELAFSNFANQHLTIGSMEDLDAAGLDYVQNFFKTYYAPNNAILSIVGDVNPKQVKTLVEKYFSDIPRQNTPPRPDLTEPKQTIEKRDVTTDRLARLPAVAMAWHGPSYGNPDVYAVDLLSEILFRGENSRAYQEIVKGKQLALSVQGSLDSQRGPSLFQLFAVYRPTVSESDVQNAIYAQIDAIKQTPPTREELDRVKTRLRAGRYRGAGFNGQESMLGRAIAIADYAMFQGDPNLINTEMSRYMAVTPEQIQAVAKKYFTQENRTVVEIKPGAAPRGGNE